MIDNIFSGEKLARKIAFEVSDIPTALQFVDRGLEVAVAPYALVSSYGTGGKLATFTLRTHDASLPKWNIAMRGKTRRTLG
ncbi:hypothetical protein D1Y84_04670 [Acidipila sp. EB88]|nr:hypothetical protein D1Y84_04670 [Acidipila sp. EB88]